MRVSPVVWIALATAAGCRRGGAPDARSPVPVPCAADRIGAVQVTGAAPRDVAALAVLEGTHDDALRIARTAAAAEAELRWRGYAGATVDVARRPGCFVELHVRVQLGPRFRIARIDFETDDEFPAAARLAAIEDALGTVNTVGGVHVAYRLQRALDGLERRYRDAGWLDARVGTPRATYTADGAVTLAIPVAAGPRYRIAAIRARGASPTARRAVLDELGLDPGGYYDAAALRRGLERARRRTDRRVDLRTRTTLGDEVVIEALVETRTPAARP